jgi:prepilin-type N-terminal cleavage/methylation domain-containing protein
MRRQQGFSLVELMVSMTVMMLISGAAISAMLKLSSTQATIWNRTQMHSGIRGATEVLQQEVGQAGRVALPSNVTLAAAVASGATSVNVSSAAGMFPSEKLTIDAGCSDTASPCTSKQEVVIIASCVSASNTACSSGASESITLSGTFANAHSSGAAVQALGGFYAGVVPTTTTNGSTAAVLKLFGDINGDGNMVYVEYSVSPSCICSGTCNPSTTTGNLYRNSMAFNAASKVSATASQILLGNVTANPNGSACFSYTPQTVTYPAGLAPGGGSTNTYVTDVAVTLTVQTQNLDPVTRSYQTETKALLNVSPRNVFNTWGLASLNLNNTDRVQPTPSTVTNLLAGAS